MKKQILTIITMSLLAIALVGCNELKDPRDGKIYRTVKIGKQVWMAENLNYKTEGSYCYKDNPAKCKKYGRLYTWNAAYEACPVGWHLPSKEYFKILFDAVGGEESAGANLKAKMGWDSNNGADVFGFSALPAGSYRGGDSDGEGFRTFFWSASENNDKYAVCMYLLSNIDGSHLDDYNKLSEFSVRCLKD